MDGAKSPVHFFGGSDSIMRYGHARVSTDGRDVDVQVKQLRWRPPEQNRVAWDSPSGKSFEAGMANTKKSALFVAIVLLSTLILSGTASLAQVWPQRTVKLIVPLGPASGADLTARLLADHLAKRWGQAVVVENRPGADGIVGLAAFLAGSDDHVLLFTPTGRLRRILSCTKSSATIRTD
jgi:hypothetical protein